MTVDRPEHKQLLIELMNASAFPGAVLELATELKAAVLAAEVAQPQHLPVAALEARAGGAARK